MLERATHKSKREIEELVAEIAPRPDVPSVTGAELQPKVERLQALMPDQDLAAIIEAAVTEKLERLEAKRFGKATAPRKEALSKDVAPSSRHIPAAVKRAVCARDGNQCRDVDKTGRRCTEGQRLEFHNRHPFALGGDHNASNIRLMCTSHNTYVAELDYGKKAMAKYRRIKNRERQVSK